MWQSLVGIADGGITGVGVGASRAKWGYLPLAHSDFIFAIIAEELGLVGVVAVLGSFLLLAFFGVQMRSPPLIDSACCSPVASLPG